MPLSAASAPRYRRSLGAEDALSRIGLYEAARAADRAEISLSEAIEALSVLRRALAQACGLTLPELLLQARARQEHREGAGDDGANCPFDETALIVAEEAQQASDRA